MHPSKVDRDKLNTLTDLPNIGKACAEDLRMLGIFEPAQLIGKDPYQLFEDLCLKTGTQIDPCMLDTFISITRFMNGEPPQPWWHYTVERKRNWSRTI
ncbi:MAG: helix-hairpin-helix domain-containing protein [Gammaproteobacteria bacterium]|nr:helix-hairpin-helix domain-containing protein [Gammaproteobacteria bacterium]